jgi:hypothetical protein
MGSFSVRQQHRQARPRSSTKRRASPAAWREGLESGMRDCLPFGKPANDNRETEAYLQADNGEPPSLGVPVRSVSQTRRATTAIECSCETRDSQMPSANPTSFMVKCS